MSLQTILEGDFNKGVIRARSVTTKAQLAVGEIVMFRENPEIGPFTNPTSAFLLLPDIGTPIPLEGEEYLVNWQANVSSTLGTDDLSCKCIYDSAGQNELLAETDLKASAVNPKSTLVMGCGHLVVTAAGAGSGKRFRLEALGTAAFIKDGVIVLQRLKAV